MKICNKCKIQYPEDTLFCNKCHSLLHFEKVEENVSESTEKKGSNKKEELIVRNHKTDNNTNSIKIKPKPKVRDFSETPTYKEWEPHAPTTLYSKIKNIPYNVLKYNLRKGLYANGIRQIESCINNRTYCCGSCSYYTNFEQELCSLKKLKVVSNAICKSFEVKPEFQLELFDATDNKKAKIQDKTKEKKKNKKDKKGKKKYRCVTCMKMFRTEEGLEKHRSLKKH
jgi:hypothetical protein